METENALENQPALPTSSPKKEKLHVYSERNWKEYLGESALIVFSVVLALFLTEYINKQHEKETTKNMIQSVVSELKNNKKFVLEMQQYNLQVLHKIDLALSDKKILSSIVTNDEFHLDSIAPLGVLYRFLDNAAWTIARNNNIMAKLDIETVSKLTRLYMNLEHISKVEEEVGKVIIDRSSRDPRQAHTTLILIRDLYHGWSVDRVKDLLPEFDSTISKLEAYQ